MKFHNNENSEKILKRPEKRMKITMNVSASEHEVGLDAEYLHCAIPKLRHALLQ